MAVKVMELKSEKSTAEIEAGEGTIDIEMPLTLAGWNIVEMVTGNGDLPVVVTSADGDHFIGVTQDVNEARYIITVELS